MPEIKWTYYTPFQAVGDCVYPVMFGGPAPDEIGLDLIPALSLFLSRRKRERQVEGGSWLGGRFCQGKKKL